MGLLALGTPLPWSESRKYNEHVRDNGVFQLVNCWLAAKDRANDPFLWGDEIEYHMIRVDDETKTAKLALDESEVLLKLGENGNDRQSAEKNDVLFHPEYGRYMLEATPMQPYDGRKLADYVYVEKNMAVRRVVARGSIVDRKVLPLTLTAFPRMGCPHFTYPEAVPQGPASRSLFLPDEIINKHVRFPTLTANIRERRGQKVDINIPLFKDTNTDVVSVDKFIPHRELFPETDKEAFVGAAKPGYIYMDSMGFGMGCCCLQVTLQAPDIFQARYLYDQLVDIAPALLSLTAASPIFRGQLADQDVRWNVIAGAVDDRPPAERGEPALPGHSARGGIADDVTIQHIPKSRYDSVDQYLGDLNPDYEPTLVTNGVAADQPITDDITDDKYTFYDPSFNDIDPPINRKVYHQLRDSGFDHQLSYHFAHLFIRDPIVIFSESIDQDNTKETDHFENIQSTNWQTLRFKPPTQQAVPGNNTVPGWRVEIRPMEISVTDFENAAFSVFSMLLSRAILKYRPNFYIPISKVEKNMKIAHQRNSTTEGRYAFRINAWHGQNQKPQYADLSLDELFNGTEQFEGLSPIVEKYLHETFSAVSQTAKDQLARIEIYLKFVSKRASGEIPSTALFIRNFVNAHPAYKHDSIVSEEISYDLIKYLGRLGDYDHELIYDFFGKEVADFIAASGY